MQTTRLTISKAAQSIQERFGGPLCPDWALRRIVDGMGEAGLITVQRVGQYRTVLPEDLAPIAEELRRLGRLESEVAP